PPLERYQAVDDLLVLLVCHGALACHGAIASSDRWMRSHVTVASMIAPSGPRLFRTGTRPHARRESFLVGAERMGPAVLTLPRRPAEAARERRAAASQRAQHALDVGDRRERGVALGPCPQLARCLLAAQHQD